MTHISPKKTLEGVIGGVVVATLVTAADALGSRRRPDRRHRARPADRCRRPGRRSRRVAPQASGRCQGLGCPHPRPRRHARSRRLVHLRGAPSSYFYDPDPWLARLTAPTRVALLGSTGSIGRQTLDVLAGLGAAFEVVAMAAGHDGERLRGADRDASIRRSSRWLTGRRWRASTLPAGTIADADPDAMLAMAVRDDVDMVIVATGGMVSLRPVLAALRRWQGRRHGQQGDARRRRPPGHAARPRARPARRS